MDEHMRAIRYAFGGDPDGDWVPDPAWLKRELTRLVEQDSTMGARDMERRDLMDERDALAADAIRFRHLVDTGAFRVMSPDMGGNHTWTGMGRPVGRGSTIEQAIDAEIVRRIDKDNDND